MVEISLVILAALAPVALLLVYIYGKDSLKSEPVKELLKAFFAGILSALLALVFTIPLPAAGVNEIYSISDALKFAFIGAAIPEEFAKFLMLWLVVRKNKYFDENMDGVVYAVFVSLGFAAFENILYLFSNYSQWVSVGISRAVFAIPGHFAFAVLMGYYFSLARFSPVHRKRNRFMVLAAPMLLHGAYDSILFISDVTPLFSSILTIVFLVLCFKMWKMCSRKISELRLRDELMSRQQND